MLSNNSNRKEEIAGLEAQVQDLEGEIKNMTAEERWEKEERENDAASLKEEGLSD